MPEIEQLGFDPSIDYYAELEVAKGSSADELKKAYRRLAKQYHPDSTGGDKAKEQRFKLVSVAYDVLSDTKKREMYDQLRESGGGMFGYGAYRGMNHDLPGLFEIFARMGRSSGRATGEPQPPRPPSFRSTTRTRVDDPPPDNQKNRVRAASDGSLLRVHEFDVHSEVVLSFTDAILGTTITIATIDGKAEVRIPPGFSSGRKLRLRGKGIVNPKGFTGDHHVTVQIEVPSDLDQEEHRLVVQLAEKLSRRKRETAG